MRSLLNLLKKTGAAWVDHDAQSMGAALAYYTVLSMAPLVVLCIAIAGFAFGEEAAQGQLVYQIQSTVGHAGAEVIQDVLKNAHRQGSGVVATLAGMLTLLFSSSAVFTELRTSLNRIWDVSPAASSKGLGGVLRLYLFAFLAVLTLGFLLLISLVLNAALAVFEHWISGNMPTLPVIAHAVNFILSFGIVFALFALIYKYVPSVRVRWSEVLFGATVSSLLFAAGKFALSIYIAKMGLGNAYGAAGSLVVLLIWVYYSAQIFLFGAEFTHIYAVSQGRPEINPAAVDGTSQSQKQMAV